MLSRWIALGQGIGPSTGARRKLHCDAKRFEMLYVFSDNNQIKRLCGRGDDDVAEPGMPALADRLVLDFSNGQRNDDIHRQDAMVKG